MAFLQLRKSHDPLRKLTCPTVTTQAVTDIAATTATGNGTVISVGGADLTERGVCWSTTINPTVADSTATSAGQTGAYTASITGLSAGTTYYVRAYAINPLCTSYGDNVTFMATGIFSHIGLHHITNGMGDFGVSVVPQTLHTIDQGIGA